MHNIVMAIVSSAGHLLLAVYKYPAKALSMAIMLRSYIYSAELSSRPGIQLPLYRLEFEC